MKGNRFSIYRFRGIFIKELFELKNDVLTVIIITCIPILQVFLFGITFNSDPKYLSTAIVAADHSNFVRTLVKGLENTQYFKITHADASEAQAHKLLDDGKINFILNIPPNFTYELLKGNHPEVLLEANGTNPIAIRNAVSAAKELTKSVFNYDSLSVRLPKNSPEPFTINVQPRYNPGGISQRFTVPGFISVSFALLMTFVTAISITREYEHCTIERLLMTPVKPLEIIFGKLMPFLILGYLQFTILYILSITYFNLPSNGEIGLLYLGFLPFSLGHLGVGLLISSIARSQFQAMQLTNIYFLPNIVFSGFLMPFEGMPIWAQWIGEILPTTHFLRILIRVMLAGVGIEAIWQDLVAMVIFAVIVLGAAAKLYRSTLD